MNEESWKRLLSQIKGGVVVPIVGCRLLIDSDGKSCLQAKVARRLLDTHKQDIESQPLPPFRELNEAVTRLKSSVKLQTLYLDIHDAIREETAAGDIPTPIRQLAEIDAFRLMVTLTPDDLLARSVRQRCAVNEIIHSLNKSTTYRNDLPENWRNLKNEVQLLYLFGKSAQFPRSFVIHDEDVLEYAHTLIEHRSQVQRFISELQQSHLLLIGCNFPDWLGRFLLRATRRNPFSQSQRFEWLIEPLKSDESFTCFLRTYCEDTEIISRIPPADFVSQLHCRWMAEHSAESVLYRTKVFISYSHADKEWLERLKLHLKPLVREGHLECWDDSHIRPGDDWKQEIRTALDRAQVAVLLISAHFFASDFINDTELRLLLAAAEEKGVRILPVILSASRFKRHESLARFQAVNSLDRPLNGMPESEQEKLLDHLAHTIERAYTNLG